MASGETLLKITDYPFAYSLVALLTALGGLSISQNQILFLGTAGAIGTLLTFSDPAGIVIRTQQERHFKGKVNEQYCIDAIEKSAITTEIDKIVGMIYFAATALLFIVVLILSPTLADNLVYPTCDKSCIQFYGVIGGATGLAFAGVFVRYRWFKNLPEKITIAGIHQLAINSEFPVRNSVENMTNAIDQNDWITAAEWGNKILEEIQYKRGKREIILRAGERVYRPLHREGNGIVTKLNDMGISRNYVPIHEEQWSAIRLDADDLIIEDESFRNIITEFYNSIYKYNATLGTIRTIINEIITERASQIYELKVTRLECTIVRIGGGMNKPDLIDCALYELHPRKYLGDDILKAIDVMHIDSLGRQLNVKLDSEGTLIDFEKIWGLVLSDVKRNKNVIRFKELVTEIRQKAPILIEKCKEKIALEWKV